MICGLVLTLGVILCAIIVWKFTLGSEDFQRADTPLSREEAVNNNVEMMLPLPKSAHNVYYFVYAGGLQDLEQYIRFDVEKTEIESCVEAIIRENNAEMKRQLTYEVIEINKVPHIVPRKEFLPVKWWNTQEIKNGYYRGEQEAYAVRVWVDKENNLIYVYQND